MNGYRKMTCGTGRQTREGEVQSHETEYREKLQEKGKEVKEE